MDEIIQHPLNMNQLRLLNAYRLQLKIIYLSDICSSKGIDIDNNYIISIRNETTNSSYKWHI